MRQLNKRELTEARAATELEHSRQMNKDYFDRAKRIRPEDRQLRVRDLVLLFNSTMKTMRIRDKKLDAYWFGPFRVWQAGDSGYYRLEELKGSRFAESFAGNRLMKFFPRNATDVSQGRGELSLKARQESEEADEEDEMEDDESERD
jgi:hypothetical protein